MKRSHLAACAASLALVAVATSAAAAPAPSCFPATIAPALTGEIPATIPAFGYSALQATAADIHLFDTSTAPKTEVPLTVGPVVGSYLKVAPTGGLTPGRPYELQYQPFCDASGYAPAPLTFTAGAAAPLPTRIGQIVGAPHIVQYVQGQYSLQTTYALADEMKPWASLYHFTLVWRDTGSDMFPQTSTSGGALQASSDGPCSELTPGTPHHTFVLRATMPFADTLESDPTDVVLDCAARPVTTTPPASPADPGSTTQARAPSSSGGLHVGCAIGAGAPPSDAALLVAGAAGAALLRRRRAKPATAQTRGARSSSAATPRT